MNVQELIDAINQQWIERLDKIRTEIEQIPTYDQFTGESCSAYEFKSDVLDIIDKYKKESEGK